MEGTHAASLRMAAFVAGAAIKSGRLTAVLEDHTRTDSLPIFAVYGHEVSIGFQY